jgi:hypothetical protein
MTDTILTVKSNAKKLAKMAAADLADSVHFFKTARKFDVSEFGSDKGGHSPGDTVSVRIPAKATVGTSSFDLTSALQDVKERSVDASLDMIATVGFDLDSQQLAHDVDLGKVYDRFLRGFVKDIAASIESQALQKATQATYNLVGTAGSTVVDPDTVLAGRERMSKFLAPKDDNRAFLMDSTAMRSAVNANKNLFVFGKKEYGQGYIGDALGYSWMENELLYQHTNGADVAVAVEASVLAPATGATQLGVDGVTSGATIKKGSVFTINGVYAVHPQTKQSLGFLQQFVVTADVTETASNQVTMSISPTIYSSASGSLQNVSALPADEAAVTFVGSASTSYTQSLMFHKEAFRVGTVPLVLPINAEFAEQAEEDGINIAIIRDFDVLTRKMITRLDVLGLVVPVLPEWACRVTN